jgi:hypothetical protein
VPAGISLRKPAALGFAQAAGLLGSGTTAPHALEAVGVQVVADRAWTYSDPSVPSPGDSVESVAGSGSSLTAAPVRPRWRTIHARLIGQGGRSGAGGSSATLAPVSPVVVRSTVTAQPYRSPSRSLRMTGAPGAAWPADRRI